MNILNDAASWSDGSDAPPIWWNAEDLRYEILIDNTGAPNGSFSISRSEAAAEGDTIEFGYSVTVYEPPVGVSTGFLNVVRLDTDTVVHSVDIGDGSAVGSVEVECVAGVQYAIVVAELAGNYYSGSFYDLTATITPTPDPPVLPCAEIGRVSRAYASAHNRTRIHSTRIPAGEKRCLLADFNGAIPVARTITQAVWRADWTSSAIMSGGSIATDGRSTQVMVLANLGGCTAIRCEATLDNGEVYVQRFMVEVSAGYVPVDPIQPPGANTITITA